MTTEPTGPANDENDPLGPSTPQPGPTGEPRTPGSAPHSADNIRADQGTHAAGTVPPGSESDTGSENDAAESPADAGDAVDAAAEEAPADPSSADGGTEL